MLVEAGIPPVCGAALLGGPTGGWSRCKEEGRSNGADLHIDHQPKLSQAERQDLAKVCDPLRVELLCRSCHARKTTAEQWAQGPVGDVDDTMRPELTTGGASKC